MGHFNARARWQETSSSSSSSSRSAASLMQQMLMLLLLLLLLVCSNTVPVQAMALGTDDSYYDSFWLEPPHKPEHLHNIDELTRYLDELKQYYTLLGRPRFGRSTERTMRVGDVTSRHQHKRFSV